MTGTMSQDLMVEANEVSKRFGRLTILNKVSLGVRRGEVVCLIGPSGAGKSTFLRCLNHLEAIDDGWLKVDGDFVGYREVSGRLHEMRERDACRQRATIGMVFQHFNLYGHMTAIANIAEAPLRLSGEPKSEVLARSRKLLDRVGLADKAERYPSELSGGEQQRVAIARALAINPKLVLMDEPTSALDPELVGEVLETIRRLADDGMTMLIVTHELAFAAQVANVIVFMNEGEIVESGAPAEMLTAPRSERLRAFLQHFDNSPS